MTTETQQEKEKIMLSYKDELDGELRRGAEEKLPPLQALVDTFPVMFPDFTPITELLATIVGIADKNDMDIKTTARLLVYEGNEQMKALPIPVNKAIELMNLPKGYANFMWAVEDYRKFKARVGYKYVTDISLQYFQVENGQVILSDSFEAFIDKKCAIYASDEESAVIEELQSIYEQLLALDKKYPSLNLVGFEKENKASNPVFWYGSGSGKLYFNQRAVRYHG